MRYHFLSGNPPGCTHYIASSQMRSYADGGTTVNITIYNPLVNLQSTFDVSLSGYLVNLARDANVERKYFLNDNQQPINNNSDYPRLERWVTDVADLIDTKYEEKINRLAENIEKNATVEIAVATPWVGSDFNDITSSLKIKFIGI